MHPEQALQAPVFDSHFIRQMLFLDQLAVKQADEKVEFYKDLAMTMHVLPSQTALYKVLPALKAVVDFATSTSSSQSSTSKTNGSNYKLDPSESHMLPVMVKIGSQLPVRAHIVVYQISNVSTSRECEIRI